MAPFKPSWEALGDIMVWQRKALLQEAAAMTNQDLEPETIETPQPVTVAVAVNVGARWV
jgi:hypothetical protein